MPKEGRRGLPYANARGISHPTATMLYSVDSVWVRSCMQSGVNACEDLMGKFSLTIY